MILKEFPPSEIGEFQIDQEKRLLRSSSPGLCGQASQAGAELTDKGQVDAFGPGGLHEQLNTQLIHLVHGP
jgi:hypothetical protein